MISDMKADATQGKDLEQAKPQKPERQPALAKEAASQEKGGPKGLEPTRYGDWENNGRCTDF